MPGSSEGRTRYVRAGLPTSRVPSEDGRGDSDQITAHGQGDCFCPSFDVELVEDVGQVRGDGTRADEEGFGDFRIGPPGGYQAQHFDLARRKLRTGRGQSWPGDQL